MQKRVAAHQQRMILGSSDEHQHSSGIRSLREQARIIMEQACIIRRGTKIIIENSVMACRSRCQLIGGHTSTLPAALGCQQRPLSSRFVATQSGHTTNSDKYKLDPFSMFTTVTFVPPCLGWGTTISRKYPPRLKQLGRTPLGASLKPLCGATTETKESWNGRLNYLELIRESSLRNVVCMILMCTRSGSKHETCDVNERHVAVDFLVNRFGHYSCMYYVHYVQTTAHAPSCA